MSEQQKLALSVDRGALDALSVPCAAYFDAMIDGINIHVGRHADGPASRILNDGEWQHRSLALQLETTINLSAHHLRLWHRGVPEIPQFAVLDSLNQIIVMVLGERLQGGVAAGESD